LTDRPSWIPDWEGLSGDERRLFARYMEVFAGFVTHTDHHLGRLFAYLDARGLADDTIVMVLSDNGASAEGGVTGTLNEVAAWMGGAEDVATAVEHIDEIGGHRQFNHYPFGWAWAGNTPLPLWKRYAWLGGVRTPLVVRWNAGISGAGAVRSQFCHAVDLFPTLLAAAGVTAPDTVDGTSQQRIDGRSMLATFSSGDAPEHHPIQYFEMMGSRGIYHDGWKAVTNYVANQFDERAHLVGSHDFATDRWSLFHLDEDFAEAHDLADEQPEKMQQLEQLWWSEAGRNQVLPLYEFPASMAHMHPGPFPPPVRVVYGPEGGPISVLQLPMLMGGFRLDAHVVVADGGAEGILTAAGDRNGGWAFYVHDGRPVAVFALVGGGGRVESDGEPLGAGAHVLGLRYEPGRAPRVVLSVDGADVGDAPLPGMLFLPGLTTGAAGMLIGRDRGLPVSDDYRPPFPFTGTIERIELTTGDPNARPDRATEVRAAFAAD
jgi:arylsulfatase